MGADAGAEEKLLEYGEDDEDKQEAALMAEEDEGEVDIETCSGVEPPWAAPPPEGGRMPSVNMIPGDGLCC